MRLANDLQLLNADWLLGPDSQDAFRRARRETPVAWQDLDDGTGYWAVFRHADIVHVSGRPDLFSSARGVYLSDHRKVSKGALLYTDPPLHQRLRAAVASYFLPRNLEPLTPWIESECKRLLTNFGDGEEIDFISDLAADLPLNVISEMMGVPASERGTFLALANDLFDSMVDGGARYGDIASALGAFGLDLARRHSDSHGLLSAIRSAHAHGETLSEAEFSNIFMQIAAAAVETTRSILGETAIVLAQKPSLLGEIRENRALARTAIDEVLRWSTPIFLMRRTATRDTRLGDVPIVAGQKVVMYYLSGNFDEAVFEAPDSFDIRRRPNPHLTFGAGQHICLGLVLARMELRLFLEQLVQHVSAVELLSEPVRRKSAEMFSYQSIRVRLKRRSA